MHSVNLDRPKVLFPIHASVIFLQRSWSVEFLNFCIQENLCVAILGGFKEISLFVENLSAFS